MALGEVENPYTRQFETNLDLARQNIDILVMLQEKTRGNLTPEEDGFIEQVVPQLQLLYVEEGRLTRRPTGAHERRSAATGSSARSAAARLTVVYKASDPLNRVVAIKTFLRPRPRPAPTPAESARAVHARGRGGRQARPPATSCGCSTPASHERACTTWSWSYVDGPLAGRGAQREPSSTLADKLRDRASQLTEALAAAHAQQVSSTRTCGRATCCSTRDGHVKVTDFGLGELGSLPGRGRPRCPGPLRIHYRAPEQIYGKKADERTDVFALGIVLYELLLEPQAVRRARAGSRSPTRSSTSTRPSSRSRRARIRDPLLRLLLRALAKNPLDRYQSMHELHHDLRGPRRRRRAIRQRSAATPAAPRPDGPRRRSPSSAPGRTSCVEEVGRRRLVPLTRPTLHHRAAQRQRPRRCSTSTSRATTPRSSPTATGFVLVDRDSKHGTFLNGAEIDRATLADGDRIELGKNHRFQHHLPLRAPRRRDAHLRACSQSAGARAHARAPARRRARAQLVARRSTTCST